MIVEANETQQLIRAHASFTLDENYKEDLMKEDEVLDDATQIFNNQNRVEDSFRANVISLGKTCKRQYCQGMVECNEASGVNISHPYHEISEGISCNGNLFCHSEGEVSRHSLVEKWTIRTVAIHDADIKAEMMFKFNEIKDFDELKIEEEKYSEYGA